jgi:hypothetical protein
MKKSSSRLPAMAALAMGLGTPAHAEDWKVVGQFGGFSVAKAHEIDKLRSLARFVRQITAEPFSTRIRGIAK